jgi:hypothetical protein
MQIIVEAQHFNLTTMHFINDQTDSEYYKAHPNKDEQAPPKRTFCFSPGRDQPPAFPLSRYTENNKHKAARSRYNFVNH